MIRIKGLLLIAICFFVIGVVSTVGYYSNRQSKMQHLEYVFHARDAMRAQSYYKTEMDNARARHDVKAEKEAHDWYDIYTSQLSTYSEETKKEAAQL